MDDRPGTPVPGPVPRRARRDPGPLLRVELPPGGSLPSVFAVSDLAQASVAAAAASLARLVALDGGAMPPVDGRPRSGVGLVRVLDPAAGLGAPVTVGRSGRRLLPPRTGGSSCTPTRRTTGRRRSPCSAFPGTGARWPRPFPGGQAEDLETARQRGWWRGGGPALGLGMGRTPPGPGGGGRAAGASRPHVRGAVDSGQDRKRGERPLEGVRVLDLTRVLAGPVATRLLAGWGAEVLRIDPPVLGRAEPRARGHAG